MVSTAVVLKIGTASDFAYGFVLVFGVLVVFFSIWFVGRVVLGGLGGGVFLLLFCLIVGQNSGSHSCVTVGDVKSCGCGRLCTDEDLWPWQV